MILDYGIELTVINYIIMIFDGKIGFHGEHHWTYFW
jgi:hypothetical protein